MSFSKSIERIKEINFNNDIVKKEKTSRNKEEKCLDCVHYHKPMKNCEHLYRSVSEDHWCSFFSKQYIRYE
jgi:hypothetical protein